jgi:hypothetical protein
MFTISAFPPRHIASGDDYYDRVRQHPDVMDLEFEADDELNSTASRLTSPGEPITSSQAFMRWVKKGCPVALFCSDVIWQWAWDVY